MAVPPRVIKLLLTPKLRPLLLVMAKGVETGNWLSAQLAREPMNLDVIGRGGAAGRV